MYYTNLLRVFWVTEKEIIQVIFDTRKENANKLWEYIILQTLISFVVIKKVEDWKYQNGTDNNVYYCNKWDGHNYYAYLAIYITNLWLL